MIGALLMAGALAVAEPVTVPGPQGPLAGTLQPGEGKGPAVVIIPGSGPTDRDGNSPLGIAAASYRLLAEALAARGVTSIRIDKRGMFGSRAAVTDPNAATIADYAADVRAWAALAARRAGTRCAWLVGHSEGGLVALVAAQDGRGLCGVVLLSAPGRRIIDVMRAQFAANPANAPIIADATRMLDAVEKNGIATDLPPPLSGMFPEAVQRYLARLNAHDPAALARTATVPVVIVQGDADLQVPVGDAAALKAANAQARLTIVPGANHVLKQVGSDRAANLRSYRDAALPIDPAVVDAVATAITGSTTGG